MSNHNQPNHKSTIKLLFGLCPAWQKKGNKYFEVTNLLEAKGKGESFDYAGGYQGDDFLTSKFWKNFVRRVWQLDDFKFEGLAAASYLPGAHRFKVWFNPYSYYEFCITNAMGNFWKSEIPEKEKEKWIKKVQAGKVKEGEESPKSEVRQIWEAMTAEDAPNTHFDSKLSKFGWDRDFYNKLKACNENGTWDDDTWMDWSNLLINNKWLITNATAAMIHELLHILLNHLTRVGKRNPLQWNLATDYAINQVCRFTDELRKNLITKTNTTFFKRFVISVIRYLSINDKKIRQEIKKKYNVDLMDDLEKYVTALEPHTDKLYKKYMCEDQGGWGHHWVDKFDSKSAEEYYRILEETCLTVDLEELLKEQGYDNHHQWQDPGDSESDPQGEPNDGGDQEGGDSGQSGEGEGEGDAQEGEGTGNGKPGQGKGGKGKKKGAGDGDQEDPNGKPKDGGEDPNDLIQKKYKGGKDAEGEGKGKGKGKGKNAAGSGQADHEKQRGKGEGEGEEHQGFRDISASARQEAKAAIREAMERSGYNPDDPAEIERALQRIPGMDKIGALVMEWFKVKQKDWRQILQKHLINCINPTELDYTMTRERRGRDGVFPGKRRDRGLDCIIAADTSGSISHKDWNDFINQIEKIAKDCDIDKLRFIQCHHSIAFDQKVNMRRIKQVPIKETGGTTMRVVYEKLKQERNKKLLVLFTDGYIDHFLQKDYNFKSIMFLSRGCEGQKPELEKRGFTVICQDDENA